MGINWRGLAIMLIIFIGCQRQYLCKAAVNASALTFGGPEGSAVQLEPALAVVKTPSGVPAMRYVFVTGCSASEYT